MAREEGLREAADGVQQRAEVEGGVALVLVLDGVAGELGVQINAVEPRGAVLHGIGAADAGVELHDALAQLVDVVQQEVQEAVALAELGLGEGDGDVKDAVAAFGAGIFVHGDSPYPV